MDHTLFRYDESYGRPRRKSNLFGWSIAILLLTGLAFAAWLGSFYIFGQPERPESYRILQKLDKIERPKRFELTAAPAGEFLSAKQLYERYNAMRPAELAKTNGELARHYIRNFQHVPGQVPYVVGRYTIMGARELGTTDVFTTGMVALTTAVDHSELLMEHVYPAELQAVPLMKQTLVTGLELKLERTHDISAVIHATRLPDGRVMITAMPLIYGSYTVTQGTGTFSLEPPLSLNLAAGWPLFKDSTRQVALARYESYRQRLSPETQGAPIAGVTPAASATPAANELIRVQPAMAIEPPKVAAVTPQTQASKGKGQPAPKGDKFAKNQKPSPPPSTPPVPRAEPVIAEASPPASPPGTPALAGASGPTPPLPPDEVSVLPAQQFGGDMALASTAGGGRWKTFQPGKMPVGRLITTADLPEMAERGTAGERVYLKGQFVVNFADANRAVLRPRGSQQTRIVVEFPTGHAPPQQGAMVSRDEARPYEITEVRKQSDGQLNVFVREIIQ